MRRRAEDPTTERNSEIATTPPKNTNAAVTCSTLIQRYGAHTPRAALRRMRPIVVKPAKGTNAAMMSRAISRAVQSPAETAWATHQT